MARHDSDQELQRNYRHILQTEQVRQQEEQDSQRERGEILSALGIQPLTDGMAKDSFFVKIYSYFAQKGFSCLLLEKIVNLSIFLFIVGFGVFLLSFVEYGKLITAGNSGGTNSTFPIGAAIDVSIGRIHPVTWVFVVVLMSFWGMNVLQFVRDIPELLLVRRFYQKILQIDDVRYTTWNAIVDRVREKDVLSQLGQDENILTITQRILRRENYIIAIVNRDVLQFDTLSLGQLGVRKFLYTKPLEWCLNYAIWNYIFENDSVRPEILKRHQVLLHAQNLASRMKWFGIAFFLFSPIIVLYLLVYYLFAYFDQIRTAPSFLGGRMWSRYAMWKFREFNELPHFFHSRLAQSREPTDKYIACFPSPVIPLVSRLLLFLAGSLITVILIGSFFSNDILLNITAFDRPLFYYVGVLGILLTVLRSVGQTSSEIPDPQKHLDEVALHIHYSPEEWSNAWSQDVYKEIQELYLYRIAIFFLSVLGVLTSPFLLVFVLPTRAEAVIRFIQEYTHSDPQLGKICSLSSFSHLEENPLRHDASDFKLENSLLTFSRNCPPDRGLHVGSFRMPRWQPPAVYQSLLSNLEQYGSVLMSRLVVQRDQEDREDREDRRERRSSSDRSSYIELSEKKRDSPVNYMTEDSV